MGLLAGSRLVLMNVRAALVRSARTSAEGTVITRSIHFATISYCTKRRPGPSAACAYFAQRNDT
jgi:hypothetical protein